MCCDPIESDVSYVRASEKGENVVVLVLSGRWIFLGDRHVFSRGFDTAKVIASEVNVLEKVGIG